MRNFLKIVAVSCLFPVLGSKAQTTFDVCPGDPPTWCFVDGLPGSTFEWLTPGAEILEHQNNRVLVRWQSAGSYSLRVTETSVDGCVGEPVETLILVKSAGDGDCQPALEVPNVFTPNGDNRNDFFTVKTKYTVVYILQIFNRWGQLVYQTRNPDNSWDGTINQQAATEGQYFWQIQYGDGLSLRTEKGVVYLTR